jgi:hypothetical protein
VAFVKSSFVTVEDPALKFPEMARVVPLAFVTTDVEAVNPMSKLGVDVADDPALTTWLSWGVVRDGQFVPSARQTCFPPIVEPAPNASAVAPNPMIAIDAMRLVMVIFFVAEAVTTGAISDPATDVASGSSEILTSVMI